MIINVPKWVNIDVLGNLKKGIVLGLFFDEKREFLGGGDCGIKNGRFWEGVYS